MDTIIEYTVGLPGSGKSYRRCAKLILEEFLPDPDKESRIWCNYPVEFDPWTDANGVDQAGLVQLAKELCGIDEDEVRARVLVFPKDEVESWIPRQADKGNKNAQAVRGPWTFFRDQGIDTSKTHIAIDEIHNFVPKWLAPQQYQPWLDWLGEIRHEGATVEFLTQTPSKVHRIINETASVRRRIESGAERRDPFTGIPMGHWLSLGTVVGLKYKPFAYQINQRQVLEKWVPDEWEPFSFNPKLYGVYNSHNASVKGGRAGQSRLLPHDKYSKLGLVLWFLSQHIFRLAVNRVTAVAGFLCLALIFFSNFAALPGLFAWLMMKTPPAATAPQDEKAIGAELLSEAQSFPANRSQGAETRGPVVPPGEAPREAAAVPAPLEVVAFIGSEAVLSDGQLVTQGAAVDGSFVKSVGPGRVVRLVDGRSLRMARGVQDVRPSSPADLRRAATIRAANASDGALPGDGGPGGSAGQHVGGQPVRR